MKYGLNRGSAEASGPTLTIETKDEPEMKYGLNRGSVETSGTHSDEKHIITEREEHIRLRPNSIARERGRERSVLPRKRASSRSVTGKGRSYMIKGMRIHDVRDQPGYNEDEDQDDQDVNARGRSRSPRRIESSEKEQSDRSDRHDAPLPRKRTWKKTTEKDADAPAEKPVKRAKQGIRAASEEIKAIREKLLEQVPEQFRSQGWKNVFRPDMVRFEDLDRLFDAHVEEGKRRNFRVYVGPGADGSSDDKLAIDMKFTPQNTKVNYPTMWKEFRKTVLTKIEGVWKVDSCNVELSDIFEFEITPDRCAIFLHPNYEEPNTAFNAIVFDDIDTDGMSFPPELEHEKLVTMNKKQREIVEHGIKQVELQDNAMWSALTDINVPRKFLLSLTEYVDEFSKVIGRMSCAMTNDTDDAKIAEVIDEHEPTVSILTLNTKKILIHVKINWSTAVYLIIVESVGQL